MTYPLDPYQRRYSTEYDSHPKSPQTSISPIRPNPNMTRHESFLYPNTYDRPQPPPLRSSHSSYNPRGGPGYSPEIPTEGYRKRQSISDRVELEELTTKGRKRKRLAKACSACHKNKRRCDGFAPCSNCEFSSRPCLYVNAQGEPIPPPRTRENGLGPSVPTPSERIANGVGSRAMSGQNSGHSLALPETRREDEREKIKEVWEVVEEDSSLSAELIDIFFRSSAPFGSMFHPPTFHHRLYLSKTSPLLLDAIYAYSARICTSPALVACYKDEPSWQRGEVFAGRAHKRAESVVAAQRVRMFRRAGGSEDCEEGRDAWTDLEEIQAFTILSIYFACLRQPTLALFYLDTAITLLRPILSSPTEDKTLEESRNRTFWLISLHDLCAAANGRPRRVEEREMAGVGLPGMESDWVRYGGREGKKGTLRLGGGEEGEVGELGHVLRILAIFSDIMTVANGNGSRAVRSADLYQHQDALKTWAQTLPSHLKFNEPNLSLAVTRLSSTLPQIALTGWAFGYMHAVAECGMFYLQAAVALQPGNSFTAQRQSQAVDNIAVVLDALGEKGREGPMMIFPIAVVSNWQDHMRSTTPIPSAAYLALDDRLNIWWAEAKQQWGMERAQVLDRGFYPGAQGRTATSESKYSPPSASYRIQNLLEPVENGLGLYSANNSPILPTDTPVLHGSTDTISTNTTHLPTPFTSRAGLPSLPPLPNRPRATSSTIPYKSRRSSSPDGLPFADGNRTLPPLRRRPEEVPRTIREDPFSPNLKKYDEGRKWSWINTDLGFKEDNNEKEGPVGIAALVSAAESEMEREKSGSWEGVIA